MKIKAQIEPNNKHSTNGRLNHNSYKRLNPFYNAFDQDQRSTETNTLYNSPFEISSKYQKKFNFDSSL